MKWLVALLAATLFLVFPALAEHPERPIADAMRELLARHVEWHAYDVSENFVTLVPFGHGVAVKPIEGLPKNISDVSDIFLYSVTGNADNSLRGELRYLRKNNKNDTLSAFKNIMKSYPGITGHYVGNPRQGIYTLVYILSNDDIIYEKIDDNYADVAVSYRMITNKKSKYKDVARDMIADYFTFRRCAKDNPKDVCCVRPDDPI